MKRNSPLIVFCLTIVALFLTANFTYAQEVVEREALVSGDIFDLEVDAARNRVYISIPGENSIAVLSLQSFELIDEVVVGSSPAGIDISLDGSKLYIALNAAGAVDVLDLESLTVIDSINVQDFTDHAQIYDVSEAKENRVYVSAGPGSSGFSRIAQIKTDEDNAVSVVASNRIIRSRPTFGESPDQMSLYIGEGFSPNSLYKLDLMQDTAPIVLEDDHGEVGGTNRIIVSPDGSRIYLASGQVLDTATFNQVGSITGGFPSINDAGTMVHVFRTVIGPGEATGAPLRIEIFDTQTLLKVDEYVPTCQFTRFERIDFDLLPEEKGYIVAQENRVCFISREAPRSLTISPGSGTFLTAQKFDLGIIVHSNGMPVDEVESFFSDGFPVSYFKSFCRDQLLETGETAFSCTFFGQKFIREFGAGEHLLEVNVRLMDGSIVTGLVRWNIVE